MNADLAYLISRVAHPLVVAGAILVVVFGDPSCPSRSSNHATPLPACHDCRLHGHARC